MPVLSDEERNAARRYINAYLDYIEDDELQALREMMKARSAQDAQWGGPLHDDTHEAGDWIIYITKQLGKTVDVSASDYMERMLKIAALAVAAVSAFYRNYPWLVSEVKGG